MTVLDVTGQTNVSITKKLQGYADQVSMMEDRYGLIVDGSSLSLIMPVTENKELLFRVAEKCSAVVCCRMSPLQKSEIVKMMKTSDRKPITAAVGDGGNDVAMIQAGEHFLYIFLPTKHFYLFFIFKILTPGLRRLTLVWASWARRAELP